MYLEPHKRDWMLVQSSRKIIPPLKSSLSEIILHVVCEKYGVLIEDLLGKRRLRVYARPRQMAMYLLRHLTKRPYPAIGRALGRDHTTVFHGVRAVDRRASKDKEQADLIVELERKALDLYDRD